MSDEQQSLPDSHGQDGGYHDPSLTTPSPHPNRGSHSNLLSTPDSERPGSDSGQGFDDNNVDDSINNSNNNNSNNDYAGDGDDANGRSEDMNGYDADADRAAVMIQAAVRGRQTRVRLESGGVDALYAYNNNGSSSSNTNKNNKNNRAMSSGSRTEGSRSNLGALSNRGTDDAMSERSSSVHNGVREPIVPVGEEGLSDYDDDPIVPVGEEGLDEFDGPLDHHHHSGMDPGAMSEDGGEARSMSDVSRSEDEDDLVARQAQLVAQYEEEEEEIDDGPSFDELMRLYEDAMAEREKHQLLSQILHRSIHDHLSRRKQAEEKHEPDAKAVAELEQRYARTLAAIDEQRSILERNQAMYDRVVSDMKDRVQERSQKASDLRCEVQTFKREVCMQAENSRTGKPIPPKEIRAFEEKDTDRESELSTVRLRNIALRNHLHKLEGQVRAREELAEGLHLIDFEQLKIENSTFSEKIEEREEELLKLRHKISKTVIIISHAKEKLVCTLAENQDLKLELAELEEEVNGGRETLNRIKQERDALRTENVEIRRNGTRIATEELAKDYELGKLDLEGMRTVFADLKARHTELTNKIKSMEKRVAMNRTAPGTAYPGGF